MLAPVAAVLDIFGANVAMDAGSMSVGVACDDSTQGGKIAHAFGRVEAHSIVNEGLSRTDDRLLRAESDAAVYAFESVRYRFACRKPVLRRLRT